MWTSVANTLKTVPLSNPVYNTVKYTIDRMAGNTENTLIKKLKSGSFAIQLDETTFAEEAILIVYVQYIDNAELKQDILISANLPTTT